MIQDKLEEYYNVVFEKELLAEIAEVGTYQKVKENELLLDIGDQFQQIPLMLTGAIKISRETSAGEEIVLYFLERGDTCTITFGSGLQSNKSKVRGVAEKDSEIIFIPVNKLEEWMVKYPRSNRHPGIHEDGSEALQIPDRQGSDHAEHHAQHHPSGNCRRPEHVEGRHIQTSEATGE